MASGWDIATNIINLVSRLPVERLVRRNPKKDLDDFEKRLTDKGLLTLTTAPKMTETAPGTQSTMIPSSEPSSPPKIASQEVAYSGSTGIVTRQGLDSETMRWQLQETRAELWELEAHLKHYCKECGPDFSCCFKHSQNLIDIARETKSMTTDPILDQIISLGEEVRIKAHPDNIRAGTYFAEFPGLIIRVSELRKPIETKLIEVSKPGLTLEQAKRMAAEEAAKRIEESWGKE